MQKLFDILGHCIKMLIPVIFASYPTSAEIWIKSGYKNLIPECKWWEHWHSGIWGRLVQRRETLCFYPPLAVLVPKGFFSLDVSHTATCFLKAGYRDLGSFTCLYLHWKLFFFFSDLVPSPFSMKPLGIQHSFDTSVPLLALNSWVVLKWLVGYGSQPVNRRYDNHPSAFWRTEKQFFFPLVG